MPDTIERFAGAWAFLSNFYPVLVVWERVVYPSSEHAFNAGKTLDPAQRRWIADAGTPQIAKRRGRTVALRDGWDDTLRYEVMAQVLKSKFAWTRTRELLLSTGDAELVEGNTWHDTHWGVCVCAVHRGAGRNHLGRLLMELRTELRG